MSVLKRCLPPVLGVVVIACGTVGSLLVDRIPVVAAVPFLLAGLWVVYQEVKAGSRPSSGPDRSRNEPPPPSP